MANAAEPSSLIRGKVEKWAVEPRPKSARSAGNVLGRWAVQWAFGLLESDARHGLQINHGGFDVPMSEEALNGLKVVIGKEQMTCDGVSKGVRRNSFGDAGACRGLFDGALNMGLVQVVAPLF